MRTIVDQCERIRDFGEYGNGSHIFFLILGDNLLGEFLKGNYLELSKND